MKLTKVAIALTAVTATFAAVASTASAAQYRSSASPASLVGESIGGNAFIIDSQSANCFAQYSKLSLTTPANELPGLKATYNACSAFGFSAFINMGTCTYNFDTPNAGLTATVDIACNNNANVNGNATNNGDARINTNVLGSECEVHIESQINKGTLTFENKANEGTHIGYIIVKAAVNGLTAEKTKDNGLCPLSGTGVTNNATYNGNFRLEGAFFENFNVS